MKLNKQKIEEIKGKIKNVKEKVTNNSKEKVPKKYYALLILMLLLGIITLSKNIQEYNKSRKEDYTEYRLENLEDKQANSNDIDVASYITAESSISTDASNIEDETDEEAVQTISSNKDKTSYIMPIVGDVIKEHAVEKLVYSETLGMWKTHPGIDIKAELGAKVKSASNGTVQSVEQDSFYGNTVKVVDEGYIFVYSNLDNDIVLKQGDKVEVDDIIGTVGVSAAGELQDQTHLHFEVIKDGNQVNPQDLIN